MPMLQTMVIIVTKEALEELRWRSGGDTVGNVHAGGLFYFSRCIYHLDTGWNGLCAVALYVFVVGG